MADDVTRICLWSGPRNVSTALMYSFAQRSDTRVVDEPLYAHYLRVSGADHPGRDDVLASQSSDGEAVVRDVILGPCDRAVSFQKHMAHHLVELDRGFFDRVRHVLLVRDPREMLTSLVKNIPEPSIRDTGLAVQSELLRELRSRGHAAPVLDSRLLLENPAGVLRRLCEVLGIPFDDAMLGWRAGARPEDGVWAPHWYANVHVSEGFAPYRAKSEQVPAALEPLLEECLDHYRRLRDEALEGA